MQTIIFYEDVDPTRMAVAAFDAEGLMWRENIVKQGLEGWIRESLHTARISKKAIFYAVLPETAVGRRTLQVPIQGRNREQRAMAENALMIVLNEKAALLRTVAYEKAGERQAHWAVSGVRETTFQAWQDCFGRYVRRIKWVSAAECALAFCEALLEDGLYSLEAPLWTAVLALKNGVVVFAAAAEGHDLATLQMRVLEETRALNLAPTCTPLYVTRDAVFHEGLLLDAAFGKTGHAYAKRAKMERMTWALAFACVILPGFFWLGLQLQPVPPDETVEESTTMPAVVTKSHYSILMEGAYQAKSERVNILSQEAAQESLAIHGRCSEVLDLADYMRSLERADTALHPLLLDLAKKTEKDRYYYEFVVEISLERREIP